VPHKQPLFNTACSTPTMNAAIKPFKLTRQHVALFDSYAKTAKLSDPPFHPSLKIKGDVKFEERWNQRSAVFMPLLNYNNEASVLFTLRAANISTHKGQVSFPGGHMEQGETPEVACLRELREETGMSNGLPICQWHPIRAVTGTLVHPVLGAVLDPVDNDILNVNDDTLRVASLISPQEVSTVFTVSLSHLCSPESRQMEILGRGITAPRFPTPVAPIWGLTAIFLDYMLKDLVIPPLMSLNNNNNNNNNNTQNNTSKSNTSTK